MFVGKHSSRLCDARQSLVGKRICTINKRGVKMLIVMGSTGNRTLHSKTASSFTSVNDACETPLERKRLIDALSELRNLLEEYAPSWYTEKHHRKAESALHPKKKH